MPDRLLYELAVAQTSNTGAGFGPFAFTYARAPITSAGTVRSVVAVSPSITSNIRTSSVDVYYQSDAPALGSNTATSVLSSPIVLVNNNDAVIGNVSQAGARVAEGGQFQLRADSATAITGFANLAVSIEVERD